MSTIHIELPMESVEAFCRKWKIRELSLFGSVLRDDFGPESDVDVLVTFDSDATWTLWNVIEAEQELGEMLGREVDLVQRESVEQSENWIRRRQIFETATPVYVR
ncbi:MAG: nucleotidyltransferase domain-containing protein [Planctomycetaceae bacterium]